jgi:regulator of cell morphogenesis and NO signaling
MITPSTTLAEIASTTPALTRELERLGLDYCCGGKRSLAEACQEQQLDPEVVIAELTAHPVSAEPPANWISLAPAELVDHLEATHHRYLKDALPRLTELATKVSRVHGEAHSELIRVADLVNALRADLEPHLRKEEEVLFPMIRSLATASTQPSFHCGSIANPIAVMEQEHVAVGALLEQEHVAVGALLEQLRALTNGYQAPAGTCASTRALMEGLAELEADTHLHVHKENNHLFPAVMALEEQLTASSPQRV